MLVGGSIPLGALTRLLLPAVVVQLACGGGAVAGNPVKEALSGHGAEVTAPSVAFRFPAGRGAVRLYRLPRLTEVSFRFEGSGSGTRQIVGFSSDEDLLYVLTPAHVLAALDLNTGRTTVVDSSIAIARLGPTGQPFAIRQDDSIMTINFRRTRVWPRKLAEAPSEAWGASGRRLITIGVDSGVRRLMTVTESEEPIVRPIPGGSAAASPTGDVVAIATDSGVVLYQPWGTAPPAFVRTRTPPIAIALSPSGHRAYAITRGGDLVCVDRFQPRLLERIRLPGEARAVRPDPLGRFLLVRAAAADSVWIVDLARQELIASVPGGWADDLPAVAPDGTVLLRQNADVVALAPASLEITGRSIGGAKDLWLLVTWDPRRPALQTAARDTTSAAGAPVEQDYYVQVSSTANAAWADELSRTLQSTGLKATVLAPADGESEYRVVLGPYPTHESADATGRKLGRPYWVYARDTTAHNP